MRSITFLWIVSLFTLTARSQSQTDALKARDANSNGLTVLITGATPSVTNGTLFKTNNASPTTITNFHGGVDSQRITVICGDTNSTIAKNANIFLAVGVKFTCALNASIQFVFSANSSTWMQSSATTTGSLPVALAPPTPSNKGTICYAAPWGFDTNSGLSWGNAKNSIMACYDALNSRQGGTIFVSDAGISNPVRACAISDPVGCGIWIMDGTDPNHLIPPAGWRKKLKPITIEGVGGSCLASASHVGPLTCVAAGSSADRDHPNIWLSGVSSGLAFYNLSFSYTGRPIVIGVDSTNNRNGLGGSSDVILSGITTMVQSSKGFGPSVDIGSNTFWIWIRDCEFSSVNFIDAPTADNRAAVLIDPGSGAGSGYVYVVDTNFNNGGFKIKAGTSPAIDIVARNITQEGDSTHAIPPTVWMTSVGACKSNQILVDSVGTADPGPMPPAPVRNDCGDAPPDDLVVLQSNGFPGIGGPATVLGGYSPNVSVGTVAAATVQQQGFIGGHVIGQHDSSRRSFAPTAVRFPNLASQIPGNWTINNAPHTTFTTGIAAPDGTNGAARAQYNTPGQSQIVVYSTTETLGVGDYLVGGAWVRSATLNGYTANNYTLLFGTGLCTLTISVRNATSENRGDGNWHWQWYVAKITGGRGLGSCQVFSYILFDKTHAVDVYAPVFYRIPAGTVSDNEVYQTALDLQSYPDTASAGDVSMLRGQRLSMSLPGSNFFIKHTGSLTADRKVTWQDLSGIVSETIASGTSTLGTLPIASNSCASTVSVLAPGVAITDSISWSFNSDPNGVTGYGAGTSGALSIWAFPTKDNVNFRVCNLTARSITPAAATLNWRVVR